MLRTSLGTGREMVRCSTQRSSCRTVQSVRIAAGYHRCADNIGRTSGTAADVELYRCCFRSIPCAQCSPS